MLQKIDTEWNMLWAKSCNWKKLDEICCAQCCRTKVDTRWNLLCTMLQKLDSRLNLLSKLMQKIGLLRTMFQNVGTLLIYKFFAHDVCRTKYDTISFAQFRRKNIGTSPIQGTPPFRAHKIWSWKNAHMLPLLKGHFYSEERDTFSEFWNPGSTSIQGTRAPKRSKS